MTELEEKKIWKILEMLTDKLVENKSDEIPVTASTYYVIYYEDNHLRLHHSNEDFDLEITLKELLKINDKKLPKELDNITSKSVEIIKEVKKKFDKNKD